METAKIAAAVAAMDTTNTAAIEEAWAKLRPLGPAVLPFFTDAYPRTKRAQGRTAILFHATRWARSSDLAFRLGLLGINDRATLARYRACGILAYSLRPDALPSLHGLLSHPDPKTVEDAKAAIRAIEQANHHYFVDRELTGRSLWHVNDGDTPT